MNPFLPTAAEQLTGLLWIASLQAALLVPLAAVIARLFCVTAWQRATVWKLSLYGLLIVPLASFLLPHCYLFYHGPWEPLSFPAMRLPGTRILPARLLAAVGLSPSRFYQLALGTWATVAAVRFLQLVYGWRRTVELVRSGRVVDGRLIERLLQSDRCRWVLRDVALVITPAVPIAACWRFQRPMVLLSPAVYRLPRNELRMILVHELAHLCQNHSLALFASAMCRILFWFHPLVRWAVTQFQRWAEHACDEYVVEELGDVRGYATLLARLSLGRRASEAVPQPVSSFTHGNVRPIERINWLLALDGSGGPRQQHRLLPQLGMVLLMTAQIVLAVVRVDLYNLSLREGRVVWTAWPPFTAQLADLVGVTLRDYPLDAFRHDVRERTERQLQLRTMP